MLSSVLRSKRAVLVNIAIMRAFVKLREMLAAHKDLARRLDDLEQKYDAKFRVVFDAIRKLMEQPEPPRHRMCEAHIAALCRVQLGLLKLGNLPPGKGRLLTPGSASV